MKNTSKPIIIMTFLTLSSSLPLSALIESTIDSKAAVEITLSTTSPNRIIFEGGAITDVIFDETKFQSFLHQKTGQAFLTPKQEIKEHPTSITVMTGSGEAQTFQVLAVPGPGEIVILKDKQLVAAKPEELSEDYHSATVDFLNDLIWGNIPCGYGVHPIQEGVLSLGAPFTAKSIRVLEGPFEQIFMFEMQNHSKRVETLKPSALKQQNDRWVFITKTCLEPGEKTIAIISRSKEL